MPSGARSHQGGIWAKCVIPGLPPSTPWLPRRATAPQPNPVACSTRKSANDVQSSTGQLTRQESHAETRDRTGDLQIFSLTLPQLSYPACASRNNALLHAITPETPQLRLSGHSFYASGLAAGPDFPRSWCQVVLGAAGGQLGKARHSRLPPFRPVPRRRAAAPQPNLVLGSIQKSTNNVQSLTGWPTGQKKNMPRPGIEPGTFRSSV